MRFRWETRGRSRLVTVTGELDLATAPHLRDVLEQVTAVRPSRLVVDLRDVAFLDCSAVGVLVDCHVRTGTDGSMTLVCRDAGPCRRVLDLTGLAGLVPVHSHLSTALRAG